MDDERDNAEPVGPQLSDELKQFAAELSRLQPREDRLDRERLAFLAGQASVADRSGRPLKILGLRLESRAWPAAFACMSAIAAALLFVLLFRPEGAGLQQANGNVAHRQSNQGENEFHLLTTRDAQFGGFQARLAKWSTDRTSGANASSTVQVSDAPILTPNGWHRVLKPSGPKPSAGDSSNLIHTRGITL